MVGNNSKSFGIHLVTKGWTRTYTYKSGVICHRTAAGQAAEEPCACLITRPSFVAPRRARVAVYLGPPADLFEPSRCSLRSAVPRLAYRRQTGQHASGLGPDLDFLVWGSMGSYTGNTPHT